MKDDLVFRLGGIQGPAFLERAAQLWQQLVANGAAIGWVEPPSMD